MDIFISSLGSDASDMEGKGLPRQSLSIFDVKSEMEFEGFYKFKQSNYINHLLVDFVPSWKVAIVTSNMGSSGRHSQWKTMIGM